MNESLKKAVKQDQRVPKEIATLSEDDAKILSEIIVVLEHIGEELLIQILNKYKAIPDKQVLKLLQRFNLDFDPTVSEEDADKRKFIRIGDATLDVNDIKSIEKDNGYDYSTTQTSYRLIVNKDAIDSLFLSNKIIKFVSEQQRDYEYAQLRKKLEMFNIKFL